jgi:hypothetical protein
MVSGHESDHEQATIERLQLLGYDYLPGPDLVRDDKAVILTDILKSSLAYRYPNLDDQAIDLAVEKLTRPDGVDAVDGLGLGGDSDFVSVEVHRG